MLALSDIRATDPDPHNRATVLVLARREGMSWRTRSAWNSLEVTKLIVAALTPLAVLLGIWVARATRRLEASQWVNQKLIEKRINLLEEILPRLNDLYCYFEWIGNWKAEPQMPSSANENWTKHSLPTVRSFLLMPSPPTRNSPGYFSRPTLPLESMRSSGRQ